MSGHPTSGTRTPSLLRQRDFRLLWLGQGVSAVGSSVTLTAFPLMAVTGLDASPFEVGLISAATMAAWLVVGLPLGAWVDRRRRRPLLIAADLGRAVIVATVIAAAIADRLTVGHLVLAALFAGGLTVLFEVAYPAYLPAVVPTDRLVDGNGKLFATESAAHVAGPSLGGALLQAVGAAATLLIDVLSYLLSAATLWAIRSVEPPPPPQPPADRTGRLRAELREGLAYVFGRPFTRAVLAGGAVGNLVLGGYSALVVVFLYDDVGLPEAAIGALLAVGAAGAVVGALLSDRLARAVGDARLLWLAPAVQSVVGLLIPLTFPGPGLALFVVGSAVVFAGVGVYSVCVRAAIQGSVPSHLLGRTGASIRLFSRGAWPVGALAGGALGSVTSPRVALAIVVAGYVLCPLALRLSLGRVRTLAELSGPAAKVGP